MLLRWHRHRRERFTFTTFFNWIVFNLLITQLVNVLQEVLSRTKIGLLINIMRIEVLDNITQLSCLFVSARDGGATRAGVKILRPALNLVVIELDDVTRSAGEDPVCYRAVVRCARAPSSCFISGIEHRGIVEVDGMNPDFGDSISAKEGLHPVVSIATTTGKSDWYRLGGVLFQIIAPHENPVQGDRTTLLVENSVFICQVLRDEVANVFMLVQLEVLVDIVVRNMGEILKEHMLMMEIVQGRLVLLFVRLQQSVREMLEDDFGFGAAVFPNRLGKRLPILSFHDTASKPLLANEVGIRRLFFVIVQNNSVEPHG